MKVTYCGTTHFMNEHARSVIKSHSGEILDVREDDQRLNVEVDVEVRCEQQAKDIGNALVEVELDKKDQNYIGWF